MPKIIEKRMLTPVTKLFRLDAPLIAKAAKPGQFVIVRVREGGERIPLTIADYNRTRGTITIVVQEVGATTRLLGSLEQGGELLDLVGPLGEPVVIPDRGHVVGIGGGFGAAALLCLMRELKFRGDRTRIVMGARTRELLILTEELREVCTHLDVCTDDGTEGFRGMVTQWLEQLLKVDPPDHVLAIGPMPMMRAVAETMRSSCIPTQVSLDPLMIDGTGMCGGCRVSIDGQSKFACVDGPFFNAFHVDFDEASRRSKMYTKEEEAAACRQTEKGKNAGKAS